MPDSNRKLVLVTDPDTDWVALLKMTLDRPEIEVRVAHNGAEALKILKDTTPHLILSETAMTGMTGLELCRQIQQNSSLKSVPFVFVSSQGQKVDVEQGLAVGAADYLVKPLDPHDLADLVYKLLIQTN